MTQVGSTVGGRGYRSRLAALLMVPAAVLALSACGGGAQAASAKIITDKGTPFGDLLVPKLTATVTDKAVGVAVVRNRVKRRLRHLVAGELSTTGFPVDVVVRALPAAASEPDRVPGDFASAWASVMAKAAA